MEKNDDEFILCHAFGHLVGLKCLLMNKLNNKSLLSQFYNQTIVKKQSLYLDNYVLNQRWRND